MHDDQGIPVVLPPADGPVFISNVVVKQDANTLRPRDPSPEASVAGHPATAMAAGASLAAGRRVSPLFLDGLLGGLSSLFTDAFNENAPVIGNPDAAARAAAAPATASAATPAAAPAAAATPRATSSPAAPASSASWAASQPGLSSETVFSQPMTEDIKLRMRVSSFNTCLRLLSALNAGELVSDFRNVDSKLVVSGNAIPIRFTAERVRIQF
jgi:hypothetical protein